MHRPLLRSLAALGLACAALPCRAEAPGAAAGLPSASVRLELERLRMPAPGEHLTLLEVSVLPSVLPWLRAGPAMFGAVEGDRGGFFAAGLEARASHALGPRLALEGSLFAGGGGGASAPVGGGLMLRPELGLAWMLPRDRLGLGVSYATFPTGDIRSTQLYLAWERLGPRPAAGDDEAGISPRPGPVSLALLVGRERAWAGGGTAAAGMDLVGLSTAIGLLGPWSLRVDTSAAYGGTSAGYMEVLAGPAVRVPLDARGRVALGAAALAGSGGGGGVDTGGGLLTRALAGVELRPAPSITAGVEAAATAAPTTALRARTIQARIGWAFDVAAGDAPGDEETGAASVRWRFRPAVQRYGASQRVGTGRRDQPITQLALKGDLLLWRGIYLTGQSGWAVDGDAGAWATGLLGAGAETPTWLRQRLGIEAAAGAGGGGGISSGGGALVQATAAWSLDVAPGIALQASAGRARAPGGRFDATLVEAGLVLGGELRIRSPGSGGAAAVEPRADGARRDGGT